MPMVDKVNFNGELFHFYLSNSKGVFVNGAMSTLLPFISGVPQGYVLCPFLFVLRINNLSNTIPSVWTLYPCVICVCCCCSDYCVCQYTLSVVIGQRLGTTFWRRGKDSNGGTTWSCRSVRKGH